MTKELESQNAYKMKHKLNSETKVRPKNVLRASGYMNSIYAILCKIQGERSGTLLHA